MFTLTPTGYVFDALSHLRHQFTWSERTFGPGSLDGSTHNCAGHIDHIRKEVVEIEQAKNASARRLEWIDLIILASDGFMRDGGTALELCEAWLEKQEINEGRKWPDWRTAEPGKAIEHIRQKDQPDDGQYCGIV